MHTVVYTAKTHNVPVVKNLRSAFPSIEKLVEHARSLTDAEGFVVQFDSGHMIKIKSDWYLAIHKAKDNILYERLVVEMILKEGIDDILPYLTDFDKERIEYYNDMFVAWQREIITSHMIKLHKLLVVKQISKKDFALKHSQKFGPFKACVFRLFEQIQQISPVPPSYGHFYSLLQTEYDSMILRHCTANSRFAEFKKAVGLTAEW